MTSLVAPRLRSSIHLEPILREGRRSFALSDRLQVAKDGLVLSPPLAAALSFFDGKRSADMIDAAFTKHYGQTISVDAVNQLIGALDDALLLDNERGRQAQQAALTHYRNESQRAPSCAGSSYPDSITTLKRNLNVYLAQDASPVTITRPARAILSPHIDYARGGHVYASAWKQIEAEAHAAKLVIIIGTDHYSNALFTLTKQNFATPYGVMPTAHSVVDGLAEAVGRKAAFENELYHTIEHSIELPLVWLQHMRNSEPCEIVPVMVGSFHPFYRDGAGPMSDARVTGFLDALHTLTQGKRTLIIASGDMAHVGPAFDGDPLDAAAKAELKQTDQSLITHLNAGDADGFFGAIAETHNENNVCGVAPFYLALKHLGTTQGQTLDYDVCPADDENTSVVSICGTIMS